MLRINFEFIKGFGTDTLLERYRKGGKQWSNNAEKKCIWIATKG